MILDVKKKKRSKPIINTVVLLWTSWHIKESLWPLVKTQQHLTLL